MSMEQPPPLLSVIIPCFNEIATLEECVRRVCAIASQNLSIEVLVIDDGSTDGSDLLAVKLSEKWPEVKAIRHDRNCGKGAAVRTGITRARGSYVAIQDADLEYDSKDLVRMVQLLHEKDADVVVGSRFISHEPRRVLYFAHAVANKFLTLLSNIFTNLNLSDMECGYKAFRHDVLFPVTLKENAFGFEPEIIAKVAHRGLRIYEIGISYRARTYAQGKKIRFKDGVRAVYCIIRYNLPWFR